MERLDPQQLQDVSTALAIWALSIANLPDLLPRDGPVPSWTPSASATPTPGGGGPAATTIGLVVSLGVVTLGAGAFLLARRRYAEQRSYAVMPIWSSSST